MTVEENLRVDEEAVKAFNDRNWSRFDELHTESLVVHSPTNPEPIKGRAEHRKQAQGFVTAFPDLRFSRVRTIGQGDWVCSVYEVTGTHKGPLEGPGGQTIPPTNKAVRMQFCGVARVAGGKIEEENHFWDVMSLMAQLGIAPQGGQ